MNRHKEVRDFWENHVNNEYYTRGNRGDTEYFDEIRQKRYKYHYHLPPLHEEIVRECDGPLLEVGCGMAVDGEFLASKDLDYYGIDLTFSALKIATNRFTDKKNKNRFAHSSGENLPFADNTFAGVYSFGVIHHTPNMQTAIDEIYRVLRPGGTAWVMIYARWSLVNLIHVAFNLPYESPASLSDQCPVVIRSSVRQVRLYFKNFSRVTVNKDYPFTYGLRFVSRFLPIAVQKVLGRFIGWHLMIECVK